MSTTIKAAVAQTLVGNAKTWVSIPDPTATRRLRELRSEGWSIRTRRNPEMPTTFEYMLTRVPNKKVVAQYV
jgi:DNA-binding HxlR family transcriptional regulator